MGTISTSSVALIDLINLTQDIASLNAVYLGISATILALLGGVFVYFNLKPLKDSLEKQETTINDLKKEAQGILTLSRTESEEKLEKFKRDQAAEISSLLTRENEKFLLQVESKVATFDRDISEKVESVTEQKYSKLREVVSSETDNRLGTLEKSLLAEINKVKTEFEKEVSSLKTSGALLGEKLEDMQRRIKELELEEFARKNQMGAVYRAIELLKEDIDKKSDYRISKSLERLKNQIEGIILGVDDITTIEIQLVRLDSERKYKPLVDKVRNAYSQETKATQPKPQASD